MAPATRALLQRATSHPPARQRPQWPGPWLPPRHGHMHRLLVGRPLRRAAPPPCPWPESRTPHRGGLLRRSPARQRPRRPGPWPSPCCGLPPHWPPLPAAATAWAMCTAQHQAIPPASSPAAKDGGGPGRMRCCCRSGPPGLSTGRRRPRWWPRLQPR